MNASRVIEDAVNASWSEAFRRKKVDPKDNFFSLGGHSLIAAKISSKLRKSFLIKINVADVFNYPTVSQLVEYIQKRSIEETQSLELKKCDRSLKYPLSLSQSRLWFLYKLRPEIPLYSFPLCIGVNGKLEVAVLRSSLNSLMKRHEGLRTNVRVIGGVGYQNILSEDTPFPFYEERSNQWEFRERVSLEILKPFHLEEDVLCRCLLLHLSENKSFVTFLFHHMIFDDWSRDVFSRELTVLYNSQMGFAKLKLPEIDFQYLDFSVAQNKLIYQNNKELLNFCVPQTESDLKDEGLVLLTQDHSKISPYDSCKNSKSVPDPNVDAAFSGSAYWVDLLHGASTLPLRCDFRRPKLLNYSGNVFTVHLPDGQYEMMKRVAEGQNISLFILLLSCFKWSCALMARSEDVVIGSPVSNRPLADQKNVIGCFVNTVVFRTCIKSSETFFETLEKVRKNVMESYRYQNVPFEQVVQELKISRDLNKNPLFQVMFSIAYEAEISPVDFGIAEIFSEEPPVRLSKFDLTLNVLVKSGSVALCFEYSTELFCEKTIVLISEIFLNLLKTVLITPQMALSEVSKERTIGSLLSQYYLLPEGLQRECQNLKPLPDTGTSVGESSREEKLSRMVANFEEELALIWQELLRKKAVKYEETFFDLGGNSILVLQLCNLLKSRMGVAVLPIEIFQYPTIKDLAYFLSKKGKVERGQGEAQREKFVKALRHYARKIV